MDAALVSFVSRASFGSAGFDVLVPRRHRGLGEGPPRSPGEVVYRRRGGLFETGSDVLVVLRLGKGPCRNPLGRRLHGTEVASGPTLLGRCPRAQVWSRKK